LMILLRRDETRHLPCSPHTTMEPRWWETSSFYASNAPCVFKLSPFPTPITLIQLLMW
jgi:hypothetical protein